MRNLHLLLILTSFYFTPNSYLKANSLLGGSISGLAWHDQNADGIQTLDESLLSNITFFLVDNSFHEVIDLNGQFVNPQTTGTNGSYSFANLGPGIYFVYSIPVGEVWKSSIANKTGDPFDNPDASNDNDFNEDGYLVNSITITGNEVFVNRNLGMYKFVSLGGTIWSEVDNNAMLNVPENGGNKILVQLYNNNNVLLKSMTTVMDGNYIFEELLPGTYLVKIAEVNFESGNSLYGLYSCQGQKGDDDVDNDDNGDGNNSGISSVPIKIESGKEPSGDGLENNTIDFCFKSDCNAPNPLSNPEFDAVTDTICDMTVLEIFCGGIMKISNASNKYLNICNSTTIESSANWFAFVAGTGKYVLNIDIFGCVGGSNSASVGVINGDTKESVYCSFGCNTGLQSISSDVLVPGETYYLYISGCDGGTCSYSIDIQGDYKQYQLPPHTIYISNNACVNQAVTIKVNEEAVRPNSTYHWKVNNPTGIPSKIITSQPFLKYAFPSEGEYIVTLEKVFNKCSFNDQPFSIKVKVENGATCNKINIDIEKIKTASCQETGYAIIKVTNALKPITYIINNDTLSSFKDTIFFKKQGFNIFRVIDSSGYSREREFWIDEKYNSSKHDLTTFFISNTLVRGFTNAAKLSVVNNSCVSTNAEVQLTLPAEVLFESATLMPIFFDYASGVFKWALSDVKDKQTINLNLKTKSDAMLGKKLKFKTFVAPIENDFNPNNNAYESQYEVRGSYDPNDITNQPIGQCDEHYITNNEAIKYTIRFQNTGNFPADNVFIFDSLSEDFDINSLKIIGQSHDLVLEKYRGNNLKFNFQKIDLPSKDVDEFASNGYIAFEVKLKSNVVHNSVIKNKAAIYFDLNEAIITNEVFNTIVNNIPTFYSVIQKTACIGEFIDIDGVAYSTNTNLNKTYTSINGCDSTVNYILTFGEPLRKSNFISACEGNSILVNEISYTQNVNFEISYNCDSIVSYQLEFIKPTVEEKSVNICYGSKIIFGNIEISKDTTIEMTSNCFTQKITVDVLDKIEIPLTVSANKVIAPLGFESYTWYDCKDGKYFTEDFGNVFTPSIDGEYKVEVSKQGCKAFSECLSFTTSTSDIIDGKLIIYPNPSLDGAVNIKLGEANTIINSVKIFNAIGMQEGYKMEVISKNHWILTSSIKGIYAVVVNTNRGIVFETLVLD